MDCRRWTAWDESSIAGVISNDIGGLLIYHTQPCFDLTGYGLANISI